MVTMRNSTIENIYHMPQEVKNSSISVINSSASTPTLFASTQQYSKPVVESSRYGSQPTGPISTSKVIRFQDLNIENFDDDVDDRNTSSSNNHLIQRERSVTQQNQNLKYRVVGRKREQEMMDAEYSYQDPQRNLKMIVSPQRNADSNRPSSSTGQMFKMLKSKSNPNLKDHGIGISGIRGGSTGGNQFQQLGFSSVNPSIMRISHVLNDKKKRIAIFNKNTFNSQVMIDALEQMTSYEWKVYLGDQRGLSPHLLWGNTQMDSDKSMISSIKNMRAVWDHKANFSQIFIKIDDFAQYPINSKEFIPKTWILHLDTSFVFDDQREFFDLPEDGRLYIQKTNMGLNGSGIRIIDNLAEYKEFIMALKNSQRLMCKSKYNVHPYNTQESLTVQHYMQKPLLLNQKKWQFRVFLLLLCTGKYWMMFFHHSYIRISLNDYTMDTASIEVHTTHTIHADKYKDDPNYEVLMDQTRLLMPEFESKMKEQHKLTDLDMETIYFQMKRVICYGFLAGTLHKDISKQKGAFHMFGNDIIFDENLNPWFIETNAYPGIYLKSENQKSVAMRWLAHDTAEILSKFIDNWHFMDEFAKNITTESQFGDWELIYNEATNYNILEMPLPSK